ncbi:MAG TPA: triose-phosphate isomerase [Candidatus Angelobacter sp.]|nr:triose-phosphate isomerase [Candidatus Angelobacter sp.]
MTRKPLIAGNWKMHLTVPEGVEYAGRLRAALEPFADRVDLLVLPPAVMLWEVAEVLHRSPLQVGAQNAAWQDEGAFTGEISPRMLAGWCPYVLLGHSERRKIFHETDDEINNKLKAALRHDLRIILAVGETLEEYDAGHTAHIITAQISADLQGVALESPGQLTIAYEPVWAIGTGRAATPEYANDTMGWIRSLLEQAHPNHAEAIRVIYGGSVTPGNARSLMEQPEIDGALVGGASLKAADFTQIVHTTAEVVQSQRV